MENQRPKYYVGEIVKLIVYDREEWVKIVDFPSEGYAIIENENVGRIIIKI